MNFLQKQLLLTIMLATTIGYLSASQRVPFDDSRFVVQNNTYKKLKIQFFNAAQPTKALGGDPAYEQDRPYVPRFSSIKIPAGAVTINVTHSDKGEKSIVLDHLPINSSQSYTINFDKATGKFSLV
jgi:hypothetical protein